MTRRTPILAAGALAAVLVAPAGAQESSAPVPAPLPAPGASIKWSGYVQARETQREGEGLTATLNRARLIFDASLPPGWSARVSGEFAGAVSGGTGAVQLRDAYVRAAKGAWSVQAGQYKTPMAREFLMSLAVVETADRAAFVDSLAPRRDVGVQVGWSPGPSIEVAAGVFNGEGQNVVVNRDSTILAMGRVALRPFAGASLGISGATWEGDSTRAGLEAGLEVRGAWLRAEAIAQWVDERAGGRDEGWYVLGGYRFLPAWTVVGRLEDLERPTRAPSRSRYRATTAGVLWEPSGGRIRGILNWVERTSGQERKVSHTWIAQIQGRF